MVMQDSYEKYMRRALDLAAEAAASGEIPVGCVIVDGSGNILGEGRNRREETRSVAGHAELEALDAACRARGDWRLDDCAAFVTLEPCPMCAGAMIDARLGTAAPRVSSISLRSGFRDTPPSSAACAPRRARRF